MEKHCSPGPDGIPYQVWKALGPLAVDILWDVAKDMEQDQYEELLQAAYHDEGAEGQHYAEKEGEES